MGPSLSETEMARLQILENCLPAMAAEDQKKMLEAELYPMVYQVVNPKRHAYRINLLLLDNDNNLVLEMLRNFNFLKKKVG